MTEAGFYIVRQTGPGFMHRTLIAHLLQLASALLGNVVFVAQFYQQVKMPHQSWA